MSDSVPMPADTAPALADVPLPDVPLLKPSIIAEVRNIAAAVLKSFYEVTGDRAHWRAARALERNPGGRPRSRDALYREMDHLLATGDARDFTDAALAVASTMPGPLLKNVDALLLGYRRWRKRHRLN
jgi:hypothetical protein